MRGLREWLHERRLARRYAKGPGRKPTAKEMARIREMTKDMPARPLHLPKETS